MNYIKAELEKRNERKEDNYAVVGTEIKNRRTAMSRTLNGVAYKTCSVSYLSKLENNKIMPNQQYVRELCEKLDLSYDSIEMLLKSKSTLIDAVNCYLNNDTETIKKYYDDSVDLNNYRAMLIKLIYAISIFDIKSANKLDGDIMSLISSMTDIDLLIFSLFSGILHYLNYEFYEALDDLYILRECECNLNMQILRDKYIFLASYALNSYDTPIAYTTITTKLIENGRYNMLDEIHYIMALYYAKNGAKASFNYIHSLIKSKRYATSANFIKTMFNSNHSISKLKSYKDTNLNAFCQLTKSIISDNKDVKNFCKSISIGIYEPDNDVLILNYLALDEIEDRIRFIVDKAFPRLRKTKEGYLIKYFFNELSYLTLNMGKYKMFSDWYIRFYEINCL